MKNKRIISCLLAATMLLQISLTGCSGKADTKAPDSVAPSTPATSAAPADSTASKAPESKPAKPLEFSVLARTRAPYDPEQKDIWNELSARTNTTIDFIWVPNSNYEEKVNTILGSGDLPDVIFEPKMASMMSQQAIIPLDDLLEYAPNIKKLLKDEDYINLRQVSDGKIYHIPYILDFPPSMSTMIRKDWLDNLGLQTPVTYEQWKAVWQAFKDQDANGDGDKNNEIPLVLAGGTANLLEYATMFGIKVNNMNTDPWFVVNDNNELISIFEHPNFKTYLGEMADLYKKGLLDQEFATRGGDGFKSVLDTGMAGSTIWFAERARLTTEVLRKTNPKAAFIGVPPVKSPDGKQLIKARDKIATTGLTLTVQAKKDGKDRQIMEFYDYVYSDEGSALMNYGIVGKHCDIVDGKPIIKPEITAGGFNEARKVGIIPTITPMNFLGDAYVQILLQGQTVDKLPEPIKYFYDALYLNEPYFYHQIPVFATEAYVKHQASLSTKLLEIFANTVSGKLSVDQFYTEYQKVKDAGWAKVIEEQAAAYKTVTGK